ncbi:MAG: hypothetical protein RSC01_04575, partial [Oscillospiraceae bacterium]
LLGLWLFLGYMLNLNIKLYVTSIEQFAYFIASSFVGFFKARLILAAIQNTCQSMLVNAYKLMPVNQIIICLFRITFVIYY